MYFSQTFLQVPAAWQLSHNVLLLKMFIANYSWTCHGKAISSMLPLNEITPAISSLGARGEFEEMIATEEPFVIIIAVVTVKNGTMFTSFLWRRHNPIKYQRNDKNSEEKQGKASFVLINTPRAKIRLNASLDVVSARLLFQDGAGNCKKGYCLRPSLNKNSTDHYNFLLLFTGLKSFTVLSLRAKLGGHFALWFALLFNPMPLK